jgi:hypothetical protein
MVILVWIKVAAKESLKLENIVGTFVAFGKICATAAAWENGVSYVGGQKQPASQKKNKEFSARIACAKIKNESEPEINKAGVVCPSAVTFKQTLPALWPVVDTHKVVNNQKRCE